MTVYPERTPRSDGGRGMGRLLSSMPPFDIPGSSGGEFGPGDPRSWMERQLFDRRIVLLSGPLDAEMANAVGVALMTLDATGDDPVQLQIDSGDGSIDAALSLMDVIDLLGVPVHASCIGQVAGPAVGVLAVCSHRTMAPHAHLRIFEPSIEVQGNAQQLRQLASLHLERWTVFCTRLAEITGQPLVRLREEASAGRYLSADEAVAYRLVDEVATPDARMYRLPGRSFGFGPR
jgi:ATP-dependent Clp protease, protease subunit